MSGSQEANPHFKVSNVFFVLYVFTRPGACVQWTQEMKNALILGALDLGMYQPGGARNEVKVVRWPGYFLALANIQNRRMQT
jgi:hypothetical protein